MLPSALEAPEAFTCAERRRETAAAAAALLPADQKNHQTQQPKCLPGVCNLLSPDSMDTLGDPQHPSNSLVIKDRDVDATLNFEAV